MAKHKDIELGKELYQKLKQMSRDSLEKSLLRETELGSNSEHQIDVAQRLKEFEELLAFIEHDWGRSDELRKMGQFRFQLLHEWLVGHFEPCRVADIGGGKGLLAYLLRNDGWDAVVIDPVHQALPNKYKDISSDRRVRIAPTEKVPHIDRVFEPEMAANFELLIGMHAHGSNASIIDAATRFGSGFVLFPCCVIDEPFYPRLGVSWPESLADYATENGHVFYPFRLHFKGQNIGLCSIGRCKVRQTVI